MLNQLKRKYEKTPGVSRLDRRVKSPKPAVNDGPTPLRGKPRERGWGTVPSTKKTCRPKNLPYP